MDSRSPIFPLGDKLRGNEKKESGDDEEWKPGFPIPAFSHGTSHRLKNTVFSAEINRFFRLARDFLRIFP